MSWEKDRAEQLQPWWDSGDGVKPLPPGLRPDDAAAHVAFSQQPARPCNAYDLTFGGRCLNCGFDPAAA